MRTTQTPQGRRKQTPAQTRSHTRHTITRPRSLSRLAAPGSATPGDANTAPHRSGKPPGLPVPMAPSERRPSILPQECPPSARLGGPDPARQGLDQEASSRHPGVRRRLVHAARKLTARPLVSSLQPPGPSPFLSSRPFPGGRGERRPALRLPRGGVRAASRPPEPPSLLPPARPASPRGPAEPPHERTPGPGRPSHTGGPAAPALPAARPGR